MSVTLWLLLVAAAIYLFGRRRSRRNLVMCGQLIGLVAVCLVVGSAFFFFASLTTPADWCFLVGSVLFAIKPTLDLVGSAHLRRLPTGVPADD